MAITVDLAGGETRRVDHDSGTYADLLEPFDVSRHEVSILVDGTPVPDDAPVAADIEQVRVVRLIKGG